MNHKNLVSGNEYILKDANSCVVLQYKYNMWTLQNGQTYYFDINRQIYPKNDKYTPSQFGPYISVFGELKLSLHQVKTRLYEDNLINSIDDLY